MTIDEYGKNSDDNMFDVRKVDTSEKEDRYRQNL
jgi:hypothetical protein